ncbi:hypothetical protein [Hyphomicrobium sp.]|uniref:hypothetical protein n=1 Tax=Hyphomicrobium sp. TaxID=82 RepID=UPI001D224DBF|nr:hypothetical protein [Hyphomicrobium sp.]MBY0559868.1 hypothetical protein [Hyphomicrobium sp.]
MTAMSSDLLAAFKASLADPDAAWVLQGAMITPRKETLFSGTGITLATSTIVVTNASFRLASAPLNLMLVVLAEYTSSEIRSISATFQGITLTTTDSALLDTLQAMAAAAALAADTAFMSALTLPSP